MPVQTLKLRVFIGWARKQAEMIGAGLPTRSVTATGHCPVPVRPRRAKTSFPGREAAPLRFAAPSVWVQKGCCAGLRSASASAATRTTLAWATATTLAANTREQEGGWPQQHRQRVLRTLPPKKEKHWGSPVETRCRRCPPLRVLV